MTFGSEGWRYKVLQRHLLSNQSRPDLHFLLRSLAFSDLCHNPSQILWDHLWVSHASYFAWSQHMLVGHRCYLPSEFVMDQKFMRRGWELIGQLNYPCTCSVILILPVANLKYSWLIRLACWPATGLHLVMSHYVSKLRTPSLPLDVVGSSLWIRAMVKLLISSAFLELNIYFTSSPLNRVAIENSPLLISPHPPSFSWHFLKLTSSC